MSIATKRGDGGTTGLLYGGRVRKDSLRIECNGAVDEAQAAIGLARAVVVDDGAVGPKGYKTGAIDALLISIERDLWVLMAEVATQPARRTRLEPGVSLVTAEMVDALEARVHELEGLGAIPTDFVVPGQSVASAQLDVARTAVRRAERQVVRIRDLGDSHVVAYLNRLSDLCWLLARAVEGSTLIAKTKKPDKQRKKAR